MRPRRQPCRRRAPCETNEGFLVVSLVPKNFIAAVFLSATALSSTTASAETILGALAKAYQYNSTLNSARAGVRVTDENVPIAKSGWRPIITGTASGDYTSSSSTRLTTGSFGIEISQSLFDGFQTRNNVRAAEAQVRASNESLRNQEQNTLFDAASAYMDVIRDRQIAVLTERNLQFLTEQARAARSRFEVGEGTRTDVAQADASRSSAIAQLAAATAQAESSAAIYRQVIGEEPGNLQGGSAACQVAAEEPRPGHCDGGRRPSGNPGHRASGRRGGVFGEVGRGPIAAAGFRLGRRFAHLYRHLRRPVGRRTAPADPKARRIRPASAQR